AEPHVERLAKVQRDGRSDLVQRLALHGEEQAEDISVLLQPDCLGRLDVELDVLSVGAPLSPVLQRGHTGAVYARRYVGAAGVQRLPEHQDALAVRVRFMRVRWRWKREVRRDHQVAGGLL